VLKTIDETSVKETEVVQNNVLKQTDHHKEMVGWAVTSQNKVNDLLQETSNQQKALLAEVGKANQ
jgi:hypothetical protein